MQREEADCVHCPLPWPGDSPCPPFTTRSLSQSVVALRKMLSTQAFDWVTNCDNSVR
jgi:hypothetical protein